MSTRVQASKFRHIQANVAKKEESYLDLSLPGSSDANSLAANGKHIALVWNTVECGTIGLIETSSAGKRGASVPQLAAHSSAIEDLSFSPFHEEQLASCGGDAAVRLWNVETRSSFAELKGHDRKVVALRYHPVADHVLASASEDKTLRLWDLSQASSTARTVLPFGEIPQSMTWNYNGSLLAFASREKKLRVYDPRANSFVHSTEGHQGVKPSRVVWCGNTQQLLSTGFSKNRDRQLCLWDLRKFTAAIATNTIDQSTGILQLLYDHDSRLLFLAGKGDTTIRPLELSESAPLLRELPVVTSTDQQRDVVMLPKYSCDWTECEVVKLLKVTSNAAVPIRFTVPRRAKRVFSPEVYPPTPGPKPALQSADWFSGATSDPLLVSLDSLSSSSSSSASHLTASSSSSAPTEEANEVSNTLTSSSGEENKPQVEAYVAKEVKIVRSSKFRHVMGTGTKKEKCFDNLKLGPSSADCTCIKTNGKYFAVPWQGSGGRLAVLEVDKPRRLPDTLPVVECGSAVLSYDFHPFSPSLVATGLEDAHVKLWNVAELASSSNKTLSNLTTPQVDLLGHTRKITTTNFHPTAENVLVTSSFDQSVKVWDIEKGGQGALLSVSGVFNDVVQDATFNYLGSLAAFVQKDRRIVLVDPRARSLAGEVAQSHQGAKGVRLTWMGDKDVFISSGLGKASDREFKLWDQRKLSDSIYSVTVDNGTGVMVPIYDSDTSILFLAGRGDAIISYFELESDAAHALSTYRGSEPQVDVAPLVKKFCDVKNVEVLKLLKLTKNTMEPLGFKVPRNRLEYFQDDILVPTTNYWEPAMKASEWFGGSNKAPQRVSLRPSNMQLLSQAPKVVQEKKYDFNRETQKVEAETADQVKENLLDNFFGQMRKMGNEPVNKVVMDTPEPDADDDWD